jgi:hypothetical protein
MKQPATLFGEMETTRYARLLDLEQRAGGDWKKADKDETAKSFVPEDHDIELMKFMRE